MVLVSVVVVVVNDAAAAVAIDTDIRETT